MTKQLTPTAPPAWRPGTYDRDGDVTGLLQYDTDRILELPRALSRITAGTADDRTLVLDGDYTSAHHFVMTRRPRGLIVTDDGSKNGLAVEVSRDFGSALKASFTDRRVTGDKFLLVPGMTFVVGAEPHRFVALDDAMREQHARLVEILGREDEAHGATEREGATERGEGATRGARARQRRETPTAGDLILAASSPGHLLITAKLGCDQEELARIIHKISQRRGMPIVEIAEVPEDRAGQSVLLKNRATGGTLVVNLGTHRRRFDPAFVASMLSPSYRIRVIAIARTTNQARRVLGHQPWRSLGHIDLCPLELRRAAILSLLDQYLATRGSVLRVADLTSHNQRALQFNPWRENLQALREAAVRLDAIVLSRFSRKRAAAMLGIVRQTFNHWFNNTMRLAKPLVPLDRKHVLASALAAPKTKKC